jgi:hypothetical protein
LHLPAEPKASAMIRNALYDILINPFLWKSGLQYFGLCE